MTAYKQTAGTNSTRALNEEGPRAIGQMAETMRTGAAEASAVIQNASSTVAQAALDCTAKVLELARVNSNAAFDHAGELLAAKSPSEWLELSTAHARKQFEMLSAQSQELTALSQKVMLQAAQPLQAAAAGNALHGSSA